MALPSGQLGNLTVGVDLDVAEFERNLNRTRSATYGLAVDITRSMDQATASMTQDLNQAATQSRASLNSIATSFRSMSGTSRFALQNAAFQVQDFVVQVSAGTSALRAFSLQAPQLLGAFGPWGAVLGTVAALAGAFAATLLTTGDAAKDSADKIDDLLKPLDDLTERYRTATGRLKEFIEEQQRIATGQAGRGIFDGLTAAAERYTEALDRLWGRVRVGTDADLELAAAARQVVELFRDGEITAAEFREELSLIAGRAGPGTREALRALGEEAISAGADVETLKRKLDDLATGLNPDRLEKLRDDIADLRDKLVVAQLPTDELGQKQRAAAEAARILGVSLQSQDLASLPPEVRALVNEYAALAVALDQANEANKPAREKPFVPPTAPLPAPRPEIQGPPAPGTPGAAVFEEEARGREMIAQRTREQEEAQEALNAAREREARIASGGRMPDEIDAANIAASTLASTLTEIDSLTFEGLAQSIASMTQQIAQMVIQALIFRAIMGGLTGGSSETVMAAGLPMALTGFAAAPAQHGAVFRRGERGLMQGTRGAALIEGAGDEAVLPLAQTASGQLGVRAAGGMGGQTINVYAPNAVPGQAANLMNAAAMVGARVGAASARGPGRPAY